MNKCDDDFLINRYNDYSSYIKKIFNERVQKISINAGFTCPNRDGSKGLGGCTYCNINSFNPFNSNSAKSINEQLDKGISFFSKKYSTQKYLAYFQAYTNTYGNSDELISKYNEALAHPKVIGLVIGTRPDCLSDELVSYLSELAKKKYVSLEFGVESTLDKSLESVNRCHTFSDTITAFEKTKNRGFSLGAHLILGLPDESREDILNHARNLSKLPVNSLKLHHLQIVKHTRMASQYLASPELFQFMDSDTYVDLICDFIALLRPDIVIERFIGESPENLLIAPKWNKLKNFQITEKIKNRLIEKNFWQGKEYSIT